MTSIQDLLAGICERAEHVMPENSGVYAVVCKVTGNAYIGKSSHLKIRAQTHANQLRKGQHFNVALQRDWSAYGEIEFVFAALELSDDAEQLSRIEKRYTADAMLAGIAYNQVIGDPDSSSPSGGRPTLSRKRTARISMRVRREIEEKFKRVGTEAVERAIMRIKED